MGYMTINNRRVAFTDEKNVLCCDFCNTNFDNSE